MSPNNISWMLNTFVNETPGVSHAQTVSADGMHLAASDGMTSIQADQFAAITSGLASLTESAAETFDILPVTRQVIETAAGWILITRVSESASLAVVAAHDADLGLIGYEMTRLAEGAGEVLSPEVVAHLKNSVIA